MIHSKSITSKRGGLCFASRMYMRHLFELVFSMTASSECRVSRVLSVFMRIATHISTGEDSVLQTEKTEKLNIHGIRGCRHRHFQCGGGRSVEERSHTIWTDTHFGVTNRMKQRFSSRKNTKKLIFSSLRLDKTITKAYHMVTKNRILLFLSVNNRTLSQK